jgi:hypothetical protein
MPRKDDLDITNSGFLSSTFPRSLEGMARLFSIFPSGKPGLALLLLRVSIAAASLIQLWELREAPSLSCCIVLIPILALLLCLGLFTPFVAALCLVVEALWFATLTLPTLSILLISNSMVLALLGPGVYSLDARLFGLRVIELPIPSNEELK